MATRASYQLKNPVEAIYWEPGTDDHKDVCDWLHNQGIVVGYYADEGYVDFVGDEYAMMTADQWLVRDDDHWLVMSDEVFRGRYTRPNACPIGLEDHHEICSAGVCVTCAAAARRDVGWLKSEVEFLRREISHHNCDPF